MISSRLSESMEMCLKSLVELSDDKPVALSLLAEHLGVTPVSANEMIHKLSKRGLAIHQPYKGATLTEEGRAIAVDILRRQRLWERFLYDHLKIEWAKIYDLSCSLEHATDPEVVDALDEFLNHPATCPRGNPIPSPEGSFSRLQAPSLSGVGIGTKVRILAINAVYLEVLTYLQKHGVLPGEELTIIDAAPMQGPLTVKKGEKEIAIGLEAAKFVLVEIIS